MKKIIALALCSLNLFSSDNEEHRMTTSNTGSGSVSTLSEIMLRLGVTPPVAARPAVGSNDVTKIYEQTLAQVQALGGFLKNDGAVESVVMGDATDDRSEDLGTALAVVTDRFKTFNDFEQKALKKCTEDRDALIRRQEQGHTLSAEEITKLQQLKNSVEFWKSNIDMTVSKLIIPKENAVGAKKQFVAAMDKVKNDQEVLGAIRITGLQDGAELVQSALVKLNLRIKDDIVQAQERVNQQEIDEIKSTKVQLQNVIQRTQERLNSMLQNTTSEEQNPQDQTMLQALQTQQNYFKGLVHLLDSQLLLVSIILDQKLSAAETLQIEQWSLAEIRRAQKPFILPQATAGAASSGEVKK